MGAPAGRLHLRAVGLPFLLAVIYSSPTFRSDRATPRFAGLATFRARSRTLPFLRALGPPSVRGDVANHGVDHASILATTCRGNFSGKWLVSAGAVALGGTVSRAASHAMGSSIDLQRHQWTLVAGFDGWRYGWASRAGHVATIKVQVWRKLPWNGDPDRGFVDSPGQSRRPDIDGDGLFAHLFQHHLPLILPIQW